MPTRTKHLRQPLTMAILAVLVVSAGAPGVVCASMASCPVMQPVTADCHGAPAVGCEGSTSQVESGDDCCCVGEAPLVSLLPVEVTTPPFFEVVLTPPPLDSFIATSPRPRYPDAVTSPPRPAGRDLLSLHQTLLN